ncbi:MAG: hypothetical protein KAI83_17395 [Thiomargarita sp.]|nr:hypothetical protein [Thiomargarita sp.]
MRSNPLDPIWRSYKISVGSFKMTHRVIKQQQVDLINNLPSPIDSNTPQEITQAQKEVEALFVFSLWATFERFVISYLQDKSAVLQQHVVPSDLASPFYEQVKKEIEFWKTDDMLELLKKIPAIDKNLIGQTRAILRYRNWIAHGKLKKPLLSM